MSFPATRSKSGSFRSTQDAKRVCESASLQIRLFFSLIIISSILLLAALEGHLRGTIIQPEEVRLLVLGEQVAKRAPEVENKDLSSKPSVQVGNKKDLSQVGSEGGAWTAQTHLRNYGFNVDWGLMEVLESACREIENERNSQDSQWYQYNKAERHVLNGWWVAPKVADCKVIEIGCGVGVYVDALKKENSKRKRKVFGIEPNPMGGTFDRKNGPKQLTVNILEQGDTLDFANSIRKKELSGDHFDLIYSIEVFEHMPRDRHEDAARFMAGLARNGTKLIFGAASPGQQGTGHIGNRRKEEWEAILKHVGFHKDEMETSKAQRLMQEYNHKKNTQVYWFQE